MEVIKENNNNNKSTSNINETNTENIPQLNLEDASFQLITKDPEKKEDQSFNTSEKSDNIIQKSKIEKSTEDNSNINISKKNSIRKSSSESNERKNSISLNIEEIKEENYRDRKNKIKKKPKLNNLSPEVYMGENIVRTEFNVNPMEVKLKRIEKEIENQYNYDYNKAMREIKEKLDDMKKKEEHFKRIQEEDKKMKEKLKNMEEYREKKLSEIRKRVEKKQKINRKYKNKNNFSKSAISNRKYIQTDINNDINNNNKSKKLPPIINSYDKYKKILKKKISDEQDFILNTEEDLKNLELEHLENYNNMNNILNEKIQEKKKLYDERNEIYSKIRLQKELEKQEKFLEKDIAHRYNVKMAILKSSEEKNGKLQDRIKKNLENFNEKQLILKEKERKKVKEFNEKQLILKEKERKKVKEYLKKINKYKNPNINSTEKSNNRKYFLEMQKYNINKSNKDIAKKHSDILDKQEFLLGIAFDIEKDDVKRQKGMLRNNRKMQDENKKIFRSFSKFLEQIEKNNINNKTDKIKLKIYNKKVKEELEEKNRKEEEELKRLGL